MNDNEQHGHGRWSNCPCMYIIINTQGQNGKWHCMEALE